jgi:ubiquinone/menaquinone biosynthesis C-methylase UbiE
MFLMCPTDLLHVLLRQVIRKGDLVVDATAGNGHDTAFLAEAVGDRGKVIAIDIQAEAIAATRQRLLESGLESRVELHHTSHAEMGKLAAGGSATAIVFNLGYLPGTDRELITQAETTLQALAASAVVLKKGGVLAVICYPGHPGGDDEAAEVLGFLGGLGNFRLAKYELLSTIRPALFLLIAWKKSDK